MSVSTLTLQYVRRESFLAIYRECRSFLYEKETNWRCCLQPVTENTDYRDNILLLKHTCSFDTYLTKAIWNTSHHLIAPCGIMSQIKRGKLAVWEQKKMAKLLYCDINIIMVQVSRQYWFVLFCGSLTFRTEFSKSTKLYFRSQLTPSAKVCRAVLWVSFETVLAGRHLRCGLPSTHAL